MNKLLSELRNKLPDFEFTGTVKLIKFTYHGLVFHAYAGANICIEDDYMEGLSVKNNFYFLATHDNAYNFNQLFFKVIGINPELNRIKLLEGRGTAVQLDFKVVRFTEMPCRFDYISNDVIYVQWIIG
jgi:hypothetical protein